MTWIGSDKNMSELEISKDDSERIRLYRETIADQLEIIKEKDEKIGKLETICKLMYGDLMVAVSTWETKERTIGSYLDQLRELGIDPR